MTTTEAHTDLSAIKERQRWTWASGDYSAIASRIVLMAEQLAESAALRAGDAVLDVATGTGNAAIAAARRRSLRSSRRSEPTPAGQTTSSEPGCPQGSRPGPAAARARCRTLRGATA